MSLCGHVPEQVASSPSRLTRSVSERLGFWALFSLDTGQGAPRVLEEKPSLASHGGCQHPALQAKEKRAPSGIKTRSPFPTWLGVAWQAEPGRAYPPSSLPR